MPSMIRFTKHLLWWSGKCSAITLLGLLFFASPVDAAVTFKAGTWATGTGTSNVAVTGVGFQPQVVCMWTSYPGDSGRATADMSMAYGCMTDEGTDQQRSIWMGCADAVDPSNCNSRVRADRVLFIQSATTSTTTICDFALVSFDADGFTVDPGTGCTSDTTVSYWALAGATSVSLVTFAQPGSTGDFDTTSVGFQPDFLMLFNTNAIALDTDTAGASFNMGMTDGTNAGLYSAQCEDGAAASACDSSIRTADAQLDIGYLLDVAGAPIQRNVFASFLSNGFRINANETTAAAVLTFALSIKGGIWNVGTFLSTTGTGAITESGLSFTPVGTFVVGSNRGAAQSTSDTSGVTVDFSLGAASSSSSRNAQWCTGADARGSNDQYRNFRVADRVEMDYDVSAPPVLTSDVDMTGFSAGTVTFDQTDAAPATHPRFYFAVGNATPAGGVRRQAIVIGGK